MTDNDNISRKNFLKLAGLQLAGLLLPDSSFHKLALPTVKPFHLDLCTVPGQVRRIIRLIPNTYIDEHGFLWTVDSSNGSKTQLQIAQTQWNQERSNRFERLFPDVSWGIVLHWFGATQNDDYGIDEFLRGFDGLRDINGSQTRTSAHFLVGEGDLTGFKSGDNQPIGILQTQIPDHDGTPFVASHLYSLDYAAHKNGDQYFVRALYELGYFEPAIQSVLTGFYDGPKIDPNYRTIAIELIGSDFENGNYPSNQEIANTISIIWAVMDRYKISALDLLGHHEIELRKSDPGKIFMAQIRFLLGVRALISDDPKMQKLVFGERSERRISWQDIFRYFKFIRDHMVLIAFPDQVYRWESAVCYWDFIDSLINTAGFNNESLLNPFPNLNKPLFVPYHPYDEFLSTKSPTGVNLYLNESGVREFKVNRTQVNLIADGECLYAGKGMFGTKTFSAIFRHRQPNGAETLSIYGNLVELSSIKAGNLYSQKFRLGWIETKNEIGPGFLQFSIAFGSTWDSVLRKKPNLNPELSPGWVRRHFLPPLDYLHHWETLPSKLVIE